MIVTLSPGVRQQYVSVLSAQGSFRMDGASRCELMVSSQRPGGADQSGHEPGVGEDDRPLADQQLELALLGVTDVENCRVAQRCELVGTGLGVVVVRRSGQRRCDPGTADDDAGDTEGTSGSGHEERSTRDGLHGSSLARGCAVGAPFGAALRGG